MAKGGVRYEDSRGPFGGDEETKLKVPVLDRGTGGARPKRRRKKSGVVSSRSPKVTKRSKEKKGGTTG